MEHTDPFSVLMDAMGIDENEAQRYKEPFFCEPEPARGSEMYNRVISALERWQDNGDKSELVKAQFYLTRLIGEQNG